jgi:hypothetical protein
MADVSKSAHFVIDILDDEKVVRLVRTPEPFRSVGEMIEALEHIFDAVKDVDGASFGLVVDNRNGPNRSDPGFQEAFRSFRKRLDDRFVRVGILLRSDEGLRTLDQSGPSPNVRGTKDEAEALAWAESGAEPAPTPSTR